MSRAVMLSVHPKWCEKIASGEKPLRYEKPPEDGNAV